MGLTTFKDTSSQVRAWLLLAALWGVFASSACGQSFEMKEDGSAAPIIGRMPIGDDPWYPGSLTDDDKVVYGDDDRRNYYEGDMTADIGLRRMADAVCGLVDLSRVSDNGSGTFDIPTSSFTALGGLSECRGEAFANQSAGSSCTAFLIAPDLVVAAGRRSGCFVFTYQLGLPTSTYGEANTVARRSY